MRKKSMVTAVDHFDNEVQACLDYSTAIRQSGLSKAHITEAHRAVILRLHIALEKMILRCLTAAINQDTSVLARSLGIPLPKHLTDEVCEYLLAGPSGFNFRDGGDLFGKAKDVIGKSHWLTLTIKSHQKPVTLLVALRNHAAHESTRSGKAFRALAPGNRASAATWAKESNNLKGLTVDLLTLSNEIRSKAPY